MSLRDWIRKGRELGASDLHLEAETPLVARVRGDLLPLAPAISGAALSPHPGGPEGSHEHVRAPDAHPPHAAMLSRTSAGVSSGIDMALWDITGKLHNVPVYRLLGGPTRDTIRVYPTPIATKSPPSCV